MDTPANTATRSSSMRLQPMALGMAVSLLAAPVNATITLPTDPLTTSARVPPNVLLVLDDSTSMDRTYMPDSVPSMDSPGDKNQAYTRNTVYYNPYVDYAPWVNAAGVPMTGGLSYESVYTSTTLASGSTTNLKNNTQTFYVPKDEDIARDPSSATENELKSISTYYRFQIHTDGVVVRSEYGARSGNSPNYNRGLDNRNCSTSSGNGWRNCVALTPTGRTPAQEMANFAAWYSYHRTRMKAAKAGVSLAFSQLGDDIRVGYRTINGRTQGTSAVNRPTHTIPIPVQYNQGLFADPNGASGANNNRTRWFDSMQTTTTSGSTPLRSALENAGKYFQQHDANGPYGPEAGASQLSCRQNFTILTTDGFWNQDSGVNFGNADNEAGTKITGVGGEEYTYQPAAPYSASDSSTLADIAMKYWKQDLRSGANGLENNVPTTSANPAFWQHMVTFGISIGLRGTLDQSSVGEVLSAGSPRKNGVNVSWPKPAADSINNIDDLLHAAVNGRGEFIAASNPQALASGLQAALAAITERTGSFSNVAANSTSVDSGTRIYQASYVSGAWTGEVQAYSVTASGVGTTAAWRASAGIPTTNRKIFAGNDAGTAAISFPSGLSAARVTTLTRTGVTNYPVSGADNAAYLAGARTLELQNGGNLRNRNHLLGDIVSSSPAYVKDTQTLYVGSNDGMLHAINANTGAELFAYIPGGISWSDLASLSRPDYGHRYFVDGPIVVSSRAQTPGKNILVGALGKGGNGLYALDVTNPASFGTSSFKWEVRSGGGLMGMVQSQPIIAKLNNGATAVITANGINSTNGQAALLVYNLEDGTQIAAINTGVGSGATVDGPNSNGLMSAVGWDGDGNGTVDAIYGGDMLGNVWKFDLSAAASSSWGVAGNAALFTARGPSGEVQPITGGITVALNPQSFKPWIFFGTGRMLTVGDLTSTTVQSLYGFVDDGTAKIRSGAGANLTSRTTVVSTTLNGFPVRAFEAKQALPSTSKGWYLDLKTPPSPGTAEGERVVSNAQLVGDVLVISSVIPTADACQADGRGYINALDAFTGTSTGPSLFDLDGDGNFEDEVVGGAQLPVGSVDLGVGMPTLAEVLRGLAVVGGSSGNLGNVRIRETRNVGRVSWREVISN
jgi:type IV pilus assembly protein PilY1